LQVKDPGLLGVELRCEDIESQNIQILRKKVPVPKRTNFSCAWLNEDPEDSIYE
jgi:hypothetical protein